jgi:hypothetical protein
MSHGNEVPAATYEDLVVTGAEREAQLKRLHGPMLMLSLEDRPVALAAFTMAEGEFRVHECALVRKLGGDEELAELVVDGLETVALAAGASKLVIFTASRVLRRVVRVIGYIPRASADRMGFERRFPRNAS